MKPIAVLGDGAWGTAVATVLAANGSRVLLWCHDEQVLSQIQATTRCNQRYLPGIVLDEKITPVNSLQYVLENTQWVFQAIPVQFMRIVFTQAKPYCRPDHRFVSLSKGIEKDTHMFATQIIENVLGSGYSQAVISGPSFARNVARKELTGLVVATVEQQIAADLKVLLENSYCRLTVTHDCTGVEIAGAYKNVIALAAGILQGAGYGENTQALVLTKGFQELIQLSEVFDAKSDTFYGLCGFGDLMLTCLSSQSRNVQAGKLIGAGASYEQAVASINGVVEGFNTVQTIMQLAYKNDLKLCLCQGVHDVIFNGLCIQDMLTRIVQ